MSEPMSDERRAEIMWRSERVGSQHWIKRAVADLLAEVDRLRSDLEAARPVLDAATQWAVSFVGHDAARNADNRQALSDSEADLAAALAEHTGDDADE